MGRKVVEVKITKEDIKYGVRCPACKKGKVVTHHIGEDGWETVCDVCGMLFDED